MCSMMMRLSASVPPLGMRSGLGPDKDVLAPHAQGFPVPCDLMGRAVVERVKDLLGDGPAGGGVLSHLLAGVPGKGWPLALQEHGDRLSAHKRTGSHVSCT